MSKKKHNIAFTKPEEPNFLKKLKEQCGYKEGPTLDTKRQELPIDDDDDDSCNPRDDEKPVVVVLKSGDLTEEEFEKALLEKEEKEIEASDDELNDNADGKIVFKKPSKRVNAEASDDHNSSTMKKKLKTVEKKSSDMKKIKNKSLLSFDEDENDDEL